MEYAIAAGQPSLNAEKVLDRMVPQYVNGVPLYTLKELSLATGVGEITIRRHAFGTGRVILLDRFDGLKIHVRAYTDPEVRAIVSNINSVKVFDNNGDTYIPKTPLIDVPETSLQLEEEHLKRYLYVRKLRTIRKFRL